MKKLVLVVELRDEKEKRKAMAKVSGISGVMSLAIDMKAKKMTVIGEVDAVEVTSKLRKLCYASIDSLGENKEEKEKPKDDGKKDNAGKTETQYPWPYNYPYSYQPVVFAQENPNSWWW